MNEKNQANHQASTKNNEQTFENQAFTVINGKVVSVKDARQMEQQTNMKTGVQPQHDNSSESVKSGEVAQNQSGMEQGEVAHVTIRPANVQSGQQNFGAFKNQMTEEQRMQQEDHETVQNSMDEGTKAKAKTTNKKG